MNKGIASKSPDISDLAAGVRNPGRKGDFALESPFIVCSRCQKPRQEGDLLGNHSSLVAAGVRNPERKGIC